MRYLQDFFLEFTLVHLAAGYLTFQQRIPNGDKVPNPCPGAGGPIWKGVGHENGAGGGKRNPFGADFEKLGKRWSQDLCRLDSDGDGRPNGVELGDPQCVWQPGTSPQQVTGITHPGICDRLDSDTCRKKNSWLRCAERCPALDEEGVKTITLQFPLQSIPAERTTYQCMIFDLPTDGDFHMVATTPQVYNTAIVHHMLLFGCDETEGSVPATQRPYRCGMLAHKQCKQLIGTWTVGSSGDCLSNLTGYRIGRNGYRKAALQIHWNNPLLSSQEMDASSMTLYYTEQLRQFDAAMFTVGQEYLLIPPRSSHIEFKSTCSGECTQEMLNSTIYISRAANHMHYMGKSQKIVLYRKGKMVREITNEKEYDYDSPKFYHYNPAIPVQPGDEIRTVCTYSSTKNTTVTFGTGTSNEMCYGFITYYPAQDMKFPFCVSWKSVEKCKRYLPKFQGVVDGCSWKSFLNPMNPETQDIFFNIRTNCPNISAGCSNNCTMAVERTKKHPCLNGDIGDYILWRMGNSMNIEGFVEILEKCSPAVDNAAGSVLYGRVSVWMVVKLLLLFLSQLTPLMFN